MIRLPRPPAGSHGSSGNSPPSCRRLIYALADWQGQALRAAAYRAGVAAPARRHSATAHIEFALPRRALLGAQSGRPGGPGSSR
jgi:hypothetical protein